jgi:hypothetical protein
MQTGLPRDKAIMPKAFFLDPLGHKNEVTDPSSIEELVRTRDQSYWNSSEDTGMGTFEFYDAERSAQCLANLVVTLRDAIGFRISFGQQPYQAEQKFFFLLSSEDFDDWTWESFGDIQLKAFQAFFVPRQQALQAVSHFLRTGERCPGLNWVPSERIPWDKLKRDSDSQGA